jgi:hypothetical protein
MLKAVTEGNGSNISVGATDAKARVVEKEGMIMQSPRSL